MDIYKIKFGDKVKFNGVRQFWFINMMENGKKLEVGKEYTVKEKRIASSWSGITLVETGDLEYSLSWFTLKI